MHCLVVLGPTATGKTRLAVTLARALAGEIVSADSRQVYRGLTIGTGKDLADYGSGDQAVPHHLIDVVDPDEDYHLFRYALEARQAIADIARRGRLPIIVGGTPLYINALLDEYTLEGGGPDPDLRAKLECQSDDQLLERLHHEAPDIHARVDTTQRKRIIRALEIALTRTPPDDRPLPPLDALLLAPYYHRTETHARIKTRLDARLEEGMIDEVRQLHKNGLTWERLDQFGLEYRHVAAFLKGETSLSQMHDTLYFRIRRFCKSQDSWFRKMERAGKIIHWLPGGDTSRALNLAHLFLDGKPLPPPDFQLKDITYGPRSNQRSASSGEQSAR
ncbi:MAG: tRNA (adenosine(37)-N6)-dimethylallyltransferase MiaA [Lentisphaeria bacterium]|nr:tRNA (adenosine(37)-N6)-dimethylallyltransferase MiaA [Lentisphaeria bacterium]